MFSLSRPRSSSWFPVFLFTILALSLQALVAPAVDADCRGFRRSDSNVDGKVDLSDGVFTLSWLFTGGRLPTCMDATDANDTGTIDLSDSVYTFAFLFNGGPRPPAPGPLVCGEDPTDDTLDCSLYDRCLVADVRCTANDCCPEGFFCKKQDGDCDGEGEGECVEMPTGGCPEIFDPVCGCDGVTYSNECESDAAGVSILHRGACEQRRCDSNGDCDSDLLFCAKAPGDCDGFGVCEERPEACIAIFDPVCGCDGRTYGNACDAASAGVNVLHDGECELAPCSKNDDCENDAYCAKPDGDCDVLGACEPRPQACPDVVDPVCGCDGRTYGNSCEAAAVGVSILHEGECDGGCKSNVDCDRESYCAKADGDCDGPGFCEPRPQGCPDVFDPVCGCDGQTYGNSCEAAAVGVSILHDGECRDECKTNADCDDAAYCHKDDADCDGVGRCEERPFGCPRIVDPVCGCDGVTYGNPCEAAAVSVSILHAGECKPVVPCDSNDDCPESSFCEKKDGDCDGAGQCSDMPPACPPVWDPVCGCDGNTYGNDCESDAAGVSIAHPGECERACTDSSECDGDGEVCRKNDGDCDGVGACVVAPELCPAVFAPVCGCDGVTYSNSCEALGAGTNVQHEGECGVPE